MMMMTMRLMTGVAMKCTLCYSGIKFSQFLVENFRWKVTVHIVWY
jgi:hypothetical protein